MTHRSGIAGQGAGGWTIPAGAVRWYYGASVVDGKWEDRLGNGNHATLYGSPTISANGITCSSGKYAKCGDVGDGFSSLTVCAWVFLASSTTAPMQIVSKRLAFSDNGIPFEVQKWGAIPYDLRGVIRGSGTVCATGKAVSTGAWKHVAMVWDGYSVVVYFDGQATALADVDIEDNNVEVTIGASPGGFEPWLGSIDDVMLFSRALSADEITGVAANSPGSHAA